MSASSKRPINTPRNSWNCTRSMRKWAGLEALAASVAELQRKLEAARAKVDACSPSAGARASSVSRPRSALDDADYRKVLGMLPFYQRAIQTGLPFPKTRRVVFLKNKPATLPGWVEVRIE